MGEKCICGETERTYDLGKYEKDKKGIIQCESCGAKKISGKWVRLCSRCGKEADKLYDLFVPHHCKKCSDLLHKQAREKGDYCTLCGALRMDCCC